MLLQACHLQENKNIEELIDERLGSRVDNEEIERTVKVAVLCTSATPSVRPMMSEVVQMIEGNMAIPDAVTEGSPSAMEVRLKAIKDFRHDMQNESSSGSQTQNSKKDAGFSSYTSDFSEITGDTVWH